MSSPARRRRERQARNRRVVQIKARRQRIEDELRNRWDTEIVRAEYVPSDLRVVNAPLLSHGQCVEPEVK
jgi:hypothetical protein